MTRVGVRKLGETDGLGLEQSRHGLRNGRSGISARAGHRRSGDPGLWVRNKEQWADRGSEPPNHSCWCERTPCQDPKSSRAAAWAAFVTISFAARDVTLKLPLFP
jgi:hypothetical protein